MNNKIYNSDGISEIDGGHISVKINCEQHCACHCSYS